MKRITTQLWFLTLILLVTNNIFGQGTNASISGKITGTDGALPGATVLLVNTSTGFKTGASAKENGLYDFRELPLGGPYKITVSFIGYQGQQQEGIMLNLSDHITLDFKLKEGKQLEEVVVVANSMKSRTDRLGSALAITGKTISVIPTPTRNFEQLAFLSGQSNTPEVGQRNLGGFVLAGGKGGTGGFTVDGANTRRMMFGATLDGAAFTISQEAIREFEVETNDYSVKNGRNSGGVVKAVTKSGTNTLHGAAWYYAGGGSLSQSKNAVGAPLSSVPTQGQYGFTLSGPIIKDKLFFFGVFDQYKTSPLTDPRTQLFLDYGNSTFAGGTTEANTFYGYNESDAQAVISAAKAKGYDVGDGVGNLVKDATTTNMFGRLDWNINSKNTFAIRYNYLRYDLTNEGNSGNALSLNTPILPSTRVWGTNSGNYPFLNLEHRVTADLRTTISNNVLNKLIVQYITSDRANNPKDAVQEPRVYVGIPGANGLTGGTIAFGQLTWIPEMMRTSSIQLIDDVTYNANNGVTWTFGTNNQIYFQQERLAHWTAPVVVYNNIADLNNNKPSFYRQLVSNTLDLKALQTWNLAELGAYAEAAFNVGDNVKIEAGLRWDMWKQFGNVPTQNTALLNSSLLWHGSRLDNTSGLNTSVIQPRFNLTWDITGDKTNIFKIGGGLFASPISTQAITQTFYNDGVSTKRVDYTNNADIMANVGSGNFADPKTWLSARINPTGEKVPSNAANIIMLDPNFKMPSTLRFNSSYTHFFGDRFKATVTGFYNVGFNDTYWVNANRKVTGTNPVDGREVMGVANTNFADVIVHTNADWNSSYAALQLDLSAKLGKDGLINFTYTTARGSGVTTYSSGGTFDDAEFVGANYYDRFKGSFNNSYQNGVGDKIVLIVASPQVKGFSLGLNFTAAQQKRFNIVTTGNPNNANDRDLAYIPTLTQEYMTPLANVAQEVRDVIMQSQGQISGVYQGVYPWMYQTSASLSKKVMIGKYGVTVRADMFNLLNMFSYTSGYYQNINSSGDDFSAGRFINLFNWNSAASKYTVDPTQGGYIRGGSPYSIQLGLKVDF
ncbi:carboxypeptidase regulatory-like domain-containing protein [Arcicella sp. LKC2W]|uniref:TonB-dependent receptor n=1 Tax=Arcicella sp. LKC2W TaxID=2984198 RepID=UPI002B20F826|nr:carboxypeptidase regulatory-like domain-containing protein [Arcicella sp. LKC2W]MEA5460903.1 carboxypeptidase regulatory-like domain-containing protein [Arcicella sp. LKC2W]